MELETANLSEWDRLELHLLDQAAIVIPGVMTVMEVIRTAEALQGLASELLVAIGKACEKCGGCNVELLCDLMKGEIRPEVSIPPRCWRRAELIRTASWRMRLIRKAARSALLRRTIAMICRTFIPPTLLDTFRECGICLEDLEEKLKAEEAVYGVDETKSFSD